MKLYGYKEMVDNRVATLVVAGENVNDYTAFCDTIKQMEPNTEEAKFNEIYTSNFMNAMVDELYKGYKHPVICVFHDDEAQRDEFVAQHNIVETPSAVGRDRQADMMHAAKLQHDDENLTDEQKNMTIEERHGLQKDDPWDRRSEEEKAADEEMKEKMKKMRKAGTLSGDSFDGAQDQRASRERFTGEPLTRTDAIKKLDDAYRADPDVEDSDIPDWEAMDNDQLARAYQGVDDLDAALRPVFKDDEMPTEKTDNGQIQVTGIDGDNIRNDDGSINIDAITSVKAHKFGGEVDQDLKEAREAEHQAKVDEAKGGKRVFDPSDFAGVLAGDGSADHLSGTMGHTYAGTDRKRRGEGVARPTLSEAAAAAQKDYQDDVAAREAAANKLAEQTAEIKGKKERDAGIFRGTALDSDGERVTFDDLPETLRKELEEAGLKADAYPTKNYPYNSELGGRAMFPYDLKRGSDGYRVLGGENIEMEGSVQMGDTAVLVISKKDKAQESIVLYGRPSKTAEGTTEISVVRLR